MNHVVSVLVTSGWEKATALGTIAGAAATFAAVLAALVVGARDRRAADAAVQAQLAAAEARLQREHELDLLLRLQREVAEISSGAPLSVSNRIMGLLLALPETDDFAAVRALIRRLAQFQNRPSYSDTYPDEDPNDVTRVRMRALDEIATRITTITS